MWMKMVANSKQFIIFASYQLVPFRYYMLSPKYVIPVPTPKEAELAQEIPVHKDVLALYPGTTCFYKATVISSPNKVRNKLVKTKAPLPLLFSHKVQLRIRTSRITEFNSKMIITKSST